MQESEELCGRAEADGLRPPLPLARGSKVALIGSACRAKHDLEWLRGGWTRGDYFVAGGSFGVPHSAAIASSKSSDGASGHEERPRA